MRVYVQDFICQYRVVFNGRVIQFLARQAKSGMEYFDKISCHVQGEMDMDAINIREEDPTIISLGSDDLVSWRKISSNSNGMLELPSDHGFNKISLHPSGTKFILGGVSKQVCQYELQSKKMTKVHHESLGKILDIKYSPSGRYISVASDQQKVVVIDTQNNSKTKCRPGHNNRVLNTFFGPTDQYVVSIGEDCVVLIYEIFEGKDPQQVYKTKFTQQPPVLGVQGCFVQIEQKARVFVPGTTELQIIEKLNSRWEIKKSSIAHSTPIILAQSISSNYLITSCAKNLCIWELDTQQKYIELDLAMIKVIPLKESFLAACNDGNIYHYNRKLSKANELNDDDEQVQSRIQFSDGKQNIQLEYEGNQQQQQEEEIQYVSAKKKMADKIIKVYPQDQVARATSFYDDHRFLHVCLYGCIIETREVDEFSVFVEFNRPGERQPLTKLLFKNKLLRYFAMNKQAVCYASETQYGIKIDKFSSWEKEWFDIQGVALSGNWMAVANTNEIRILDMSGNFIKNICFDRPLIAMQAYENLLAVVYHEGIPIYQAQLLSMKIFTVNQYQTVAVSECHVPLSLPHPGEKGYILRWFGFSLEGMIFTQDSFGALRAYSLESNQWTLVYGDNVNDHKKAWIIGFIDYSILYWRTTDSEPEPTVRPRLNEKNSKIMIQTLNQYASQLANLPHILWQRFCLDHELARWRLWGRHKAIRNDKHVNYDCSKTIINQKTIFDKHLHLDVQLYSIVKYQLKQTSPEKALNFVKSHIKTLEAGRNLADLFDQHNHRSLAIQLEYFFDEKEKQIEYEAMQQLNLKQLRSKAQVSIKPKRDNPMNPKNKKGLNNNISYHISSQPSQNSSIMEDITHKSQQNSKVQPEFQNPFLKKKSIDDRNQQIQQHLQKYGVKRKVEEKRKSKP